MLRFERQITRVPVQDSYIDWMQTAMANGLIEAPFMPDDELDEISTSHLLAFFELVARKLNIFRDEQAELEFEDRISDDNHVAVGALEPDDEITRIKSNKILRFNGSNSSSQKISKEYSFLMLNKKNKASNKTLREMIRGKNNDLSETKLPSSMLYNGNISELVYLSLTLRSLRTLS